MQWYQRGNFYKKRLIREIKFIEEYKERVPQSRMQYQFSGENKNFVVWYLHEYRGRKYGILCIYPVLYPHIRISVRVYEYDSAKKNIVSFEKGYHNTNGVLCLLGHYPNEWNEDYGIEYIIKRVEEWFEEGQYDKNNIIPVNYNIENEIFIFPEPLINATNDDYRIFEYYYIREKACIVTKTYSRKEITKAEVLPQSLILDVGEKQKGLIIFTTKPPISKVPIYFSDIKTYFNCFKHGTRGLIKFAESNGICFPIPVVIIFKNYNYEGQAFFIKKIKDNLDIDVCRFNQLRIYEDIFSRVKDKDELDYLQKKKIGIIGLGAIGSTVATELARSGVSNFLLIDYDKLEIQNIGRHDLTLKDIDKYKVKAVEEKILDINPKAKCTSYNWNVLDDYSIALYKLLNCDLVISTIDDQEARFAIDSALVPEGKKVIYAGAFYNSIAGFVLVSDKKMGCFKCISIRMDCMAENSEIPDFSAMLPSDSKYNCGVPTFPGGSINTHTISLLTARISLDTLLGKREKNQNGYPFNLYLLGNESLEIGEKKFFEGYMDVKKYVIPGIKGCKICDDESVLLEEEIIFYETIMENI